MQNDTEPCLDRPGSVYLTGDGLCVEICPDLFFMSDDGLAYVKDRGELENTKDPRLKMATGLAVIPDDIMDVTIEAAEECPGECIFIEVG